MLRVVQGTRELLHEALSSGEVGLDGFCKSLPRLFAEALQEIRVAEETLSTWSAIASRWR